LKKLGVGSVNLSLDTLDRDRFFAIARRDELPQVLLTLENLLRYNIKVKLNAVIMEGKNTQDIIPLTRLTRELPVSVRFIEEMPFNGEGHQYSGISWNDQRILATILEEYPDLQKLSDPPFSTSRNYQIPGHKGNIGIIAAYSRSFCGTCNRIRITPQGQLKTCLYDNGIVNVKDKLREGYTDDEISRVLLQAFNKKAKDGWEAERNNSDIFQSMAEIGG
jgi:cyclic pyranopterin phosphate synthase